MSRVFGMIAAVGVLALAGAATDALAQTKIKPAPAASTAFSNDQNAWGPSAGDKALQWNGKGRWGLKLDYDQPTQRSVQWKDVDAGVAFKATKHFQLSATVNFNDGSFPHTVSPDEKPQPRVRLESTFRF